jgi:hypothetical protein
MVGFLKQAWGTCSHGLASWCDVCSLLMLLMDCTIIDHYRQPSNGVVADSGAVEDACSGRRQGAGDMIVAGP